MQRAVLVGCGAMSKAWFEAVRTIGDVEIVGVVDLDTARAETRATEFGLASALIGNNLARVLAETSPDVLFDIVVPAARHATVAAGLEAGCHVLSEKPMAETLEEARDLVRRAQEAGRVHAVVQNRRYLAQIRRIRRLIESGAIGEVTSIHCDFFLAPHFGGFREEMPHVLFLDMAIHTFDAARFMAGAAATAVYAQEWEPANSWYSQGSSAAAIFEFADGAIFTYRGSWCADGLRTSWESAWRIVGSKGSVVWDGHDDIRAEAVTSGKDGLFSGVAAVGIPPLDASDRVGGHLGVMQDFIAATRGGPVPETIGTENIKSLAMVFGAIDSAESGRRIEITI
ncbi:Gfo/Idh/MocA family protein [Phyllobacterium zundukense]|uniref:Oxidoreductase n=1 Tax=Phyllobacterium zundukense TaxID=1867719 RepID=A0A2N9W224_9HYPH|nr:Gfo/Idh/MocA family oxidoreductase [Phyllobacterium zundukense]ATU90666.1 oxidoreductase [Phyllobacterium zundukense]PIO45792.1 oxidoreductase [Phyllobacterium zundukense]